MVILMTLCCNYVCIIIYMLTQINENGIISFGSRYNVRTPRSFPLSGGIQLIAPYWADVDTRGTGTIYYRQTTDPDLLARATSEIRAAFPESRNFTIQNLLIATWYRVGYYYQSSDKVRTTCTYFCKPNYMSQIKSYIYPNSYTIIPILYGKH